MGSRMKVQGEKSQEPTKAEAAAEQASSPGPRGAGTSWSRLSQQLSQCSQGPSRNFNHVGLVQGKEAITPVHKGFQPKLLKGCF